MVGLVTEMHLAEVVSPGVDGAHRVDEMCITIVVDPTPDIGACALEKSNEQGCGDDNSASVHSNIMTAIGFEPIDACHKSGLNIGDNYQRRAIDKSVYGHFETFNSLFLLYYSD